jgi:NAD(P)H dehydrogenase (quinone)
MRVDENKVAFVARDDVARSLAGLVTSEGHDGAIYNATGPASFTGAERAALVAKLAGKPVAFMALPEEVLRGGLAQAGLPPEIVQAVVSIQQGFATGGFDIVTGDVEKLSGLAPKNAGVDVEEKPSFLIFRTTGAGRCGFERRPRITLGFFAQMV